MRQNEILVGKTYDGKYGAARKIVRYDPPPFDRVLWRRGNGDMNICSVRAFARWALREAADAAE